ncbi:MAG TPA: hypothetical protein VKZ85_17795 [Woeseiaceae bacterium]|nr:hypothetical protein [Woeseiaceae bacterium]
MIISASGLAVLVSVALAVTVAAPLLLLALLVRDLKRGELW